MGATLDSRAEHDHGHVLRGALQAHADLVCGEDRIRHREPHGLQGQLDFDAGTRQVRNRASLDGTSLPLLTEIPLSPPWPLMVSPRSTTLIPVPAMSMPLATGEHGDARVHAVGRGDRNALVDRYPAVSARIDNDELAVGIGDAKCCAEGTARRHERAIGRDVRVVASRRNERPLGRCRGFNGGQEGEQRDGCRYKGSA